MDIYDIKRAVAHKSPFYFSRSTLRFFGQTMHMFRVVTSPQGKTFVYAPMYVDGNLAGYSFREFTGDDLVSVSPRPNTLSEVNQYIREH